MCNADERSSTKAPADVEAVAVEVRRQPKLAGCSPFFASIGSVLSLAKRQPLQPDDLLLVNPADDVRKAANALHKNWQRELDRFKAEKAAAKPGDKKPPVPPTLRRAVWPLVYPLWRVAIVFFATSIALMFMGPLLLTLTVRLISDTQDCAALAVEGGGGSDVKEGTILSLPPVPESCRIPSIYLGYAYAAALLCSKMLESICQTWHAHLMTRAALRARAAIINAIYRKCLWLSGMGGADSTTGRIQNLMANDAQFFLQLAPMFNTVFATPIQITVAFTWLGLLIGPAFLAGVGVMFLAVPIQAKVMKVYFGARVKMLKLTDERVKLTNEMVQGMRVIKMYSWEAAVSEKIVELRGRELKCIRTQRILSAFLSAFQTAQPLLVTVATFSTYAATGNAFDAAIILPAMSLLSMLRMPLAFLPMILMQLANLQVGFSGRLWRASKPPAETLEPAKEAPQEPAKVEKAEVKADVKADGGNAPTKDADGGFAPTKDADGGNAPTKDADGGATAAAEASRSKSGRAARFSREGRKSKEAPPKAPEPLTLHRLELSFPPGALTMVAGAVGSGKSSLLAALLGELRPDAAAAEAAAANPEANVDGIVLEGRIAYFAQTAFILNETVRGNILLGLPLDVEWYERVLHACALLPDLKVLPGGDMTQIGEKGINLSGGQKARIALARAVYARASIVLLDDPLSAVDAHVGQHIFRHVLGPNGLLASTTRILVTHQTQFLPFADKIVVLEDGQVLAHGTYKALRNSDTDLSAIASLSTDAEGEADRLLGGAEAADAEEPKDGEDAKDSEDAEVAKDGAVRSETTVGNKMATAEGSVIIKDEERATGAVSWASHRKYLDAMGGPALGLLLVIACTWDRYVAITTDFWLTVWINPASSTTLGTIARPRDELSFWVPIYVAGAVIAGVSIFARSALFGVKMGLRAARILYARLSTSVLAAPMLFFETTPSGRILNRFTSDTEQMDFGLLMTLAQWINCVTAALGALGLIAVVNPWFLVTLPFFFTIYLLAYRTSSSATRDLQRLEATSRSPIFTQFSETLNGLSTIRAFGATDRFESASIALVAENTRCFYNQDYASQWISMRLDFCSACISAVTILLPTMTIHLGAALTTSPAAFGLCITYALELSAFLKFGTKMTLDIQKGMAAVERILEYADSTPSEPKGGEPTPPAPWPSHGRLVASDLCVRYRPELDLALDRVSCIVEAQAKVGIVGRTGSGKSTFVSALWRLVEPSRAGAPLGPGHGALCIDGVDISTLELHALRSQLAIILQDPVVFNDSVRYNLDPFKQHTDEELRQVLRLVQLEEPLAKLERGLEAPVGEGGSNFSVGQRQLICLARAMLRKSKVIVLDEATASIDNETDAILQSTIRRVFAESTVLTIAHRLHTIMDSTQILLFDKGELKEDAPPTTLLEDPSSLFSKLVDDTGSASQHLRTLAAAAAAGSSE